MPGPAGCFIFTFSLLVSYRVVPQLVEEIEACEESFFKNLPSSTIVCINLLEDTYAGLLEEIIHYPSTVYGWLLLSHLDADNQSAVTILPLSSTLQVGKLEPEYCTSRQPVILVLDSNDEMLPLVSMPILGEQEVYRMPSVAIIFATLPRKSILEEAVDLEIDRFAIALLKAFVDDRLMSSSGCMQCSILAEEVKSMIVTDWKRGYYSGSRSLQTSIFIGALLLLWDMAAASSRFSISSQPPGPQPPLPFYLLSSLRSSSSPLRQPPLTS
ncbi:hypothetical protein Cgig2_012997 [Carnegiea gigantea]|uniref:Uncharacterized protein n=1 Tax=Carnegiea gigantea TaxID=171969 RepID=A0A9Q1K7Z4_9CARY|nr:hypothetical protein Cgig2_012997 [Carnegiea gigantea]